MTGNTRAGQDPDHATSLVEELTLDVGEAAPRPRPDTLERPHINGRLPAEHHVAYERDLLPADLEALKLPRGTAPRSLVRIHASHHSLARCLAAGMRPMQASLVTGYSPGRISALSNDPAFSALVEDYRQEAKSVFADMGERLADFSMDALEILHERLHDSPETFTIPMLLDVVKTGADRTGFGPGQEVHLKVDRDFIDRPPRETHEEWQARRARELAADAADCMVPSTRTTN